MKTQKTNIATRLKKAGLVLLMVLVTGMVVNAQKSFHSFGSLPIWKSETASSVKSLSTAIAVVEVDLYSNSLDFVVDEAFEVEAWMTSEWIAPANVLAETAVEEQVQIEDWMINFSVLENEDIEKEIQLEAWMYSNDSWK